MLGTHPRDDRVLRYVSAFCPRCHHERPERPLAEVRRLAGYLAASPDGSVWLVRGCPDHGLIRTLYDEAAEILAYLEQWALPAGRHTPDLFGAFGSVPAYLSDLNKQQARHTCTLIADVGGSCGLCSPTCYVACWPQLRGAVPVGQVLANLDARIARGGGRLDLLVLSGGEPTLHPRLFELLDAVLERPVARLLIETNGIEIAQSDRLLAYLRRHRSRVEIALQFDGVRLEARRQLPGGDLRRLKERAIQRLSAAGIFTTLTMEAALGVNDDEIGAVVRLALDAPFVGVTIRPQFDDGHGTPPDPERRLTHTGALARLGPQTGGLVSWRDFTALPCSHPHCGSVSYMTLTERGEWRSLAALVGHERLKARLAGNGIAEPGLPAEASRRVKEALLGLLSEEGGLSHPQAGELFRNVCEGHDLGLAALLRSADDAPGRGDEVRDLIGRRVRRIAVKPFMDISTMLEERLLRCGVHVGTVTDGVHQCAPFCAVQAWPALRRQRLGETVRRDTAALDPAL